MSAFLRFRFYLVLFGFVTFVSASCSSTPDKPATDTKTTADSDTTAPTPDASADQSDQGGPGQCPGENPQGCGETGCSDGFVCDTSGDPCAPSTCYCDTEFGEWTCTGDCMGGVCVPEPTACPGENPQGCGDTGCEEGFVCDTSGDPCVSSTCDCDAESGSWVCTSDCMGGTCVPEPTACPGANPEGCVNTGCDEGFVCDTSGDPCVSSNCDCNESTGDWTCDSDCNGGTCVPEPTACPGESPAGCVETGCQDGFVCDTSGEPCVSSNCFCDAASGTWTCTDDCGGGTCVAQQSCDTNPEGCRHNGCDDGLLCTIGETCIPSDCTTCNEELSLWNCTKDCGGGSCEPMPTCEGDKVPTIDGCIGCSQVTTAIQGLKEASIGMFTSCETVDDCTTTNDGTVCAGACPIAVNENYVLAYQTFLGVISSNYCQGYVAKCGYMTPSCAQGTLVCKDNVCQQEF